MHTIDEIAALLHIHKTAHEVGNLTNISGAALTRLKQINEEMGPNGFGRSQEQSEVESEEVDESGDGEPAPEDPPPGAVLPRRRL